MPLHTIAPDWDSHSDLVDCIIELERLRVRNLGGTTPPHIFFQLKDIFHRLESLGSSRIEGNRTTLAELTEKIINSNFEKSASDDEELQEILNIERAIQFVEEHVHDGERIVRAHVSEIHKIITDNLSPSHRKKGGEGSDAPGDFRKKPVLIKGSKFCPPDFTQVPDYMEELLNFINEDAPSKDHLLRVAIAHHRFACIHPFDNGNGRTVRAFTYAMLIKYGFQVQKGHILNPAAVFCMDREKYYDMLELADSGEKDDILKWCEYVLNGLLGEIRKIDKLLDYSYLQTKILLPAVHDAKEHKLITDEEYTLLCSIINTPNIFLKANDVKQILNIESSVSTSRKIKLLCEKGLLQPIKKGGRIYTIAFKNKYLLRGIHLTLEKEGFAPGLSEN